MSKILMLTGLVIAVAGVIFWAGERFFGRVGGGLPGDISIRRGNFTFVFPIVSCIVLSIVLSLLMQLFAGRGGPR